MSKISIAQYNEINKDWHDAKKELEEAEIEFHKADACQIVDNCPICKGTGEVEDGYGNLNHNPYGVLLYKECSKCNGKGYIE